MLNPLAPSSICNPLMKMEIRFDGFQKPGGLLTVNGARFGMVRNGGARAHQGIDLHAISGTPVYAVATGEIVRIRQQHPEYGKFILLRFHPERNLAHRCQISESKDLFVLYAHLSSIEVDVGLVQRGHKIGATGTTGTGDQRYPHLHLEVRTEFDASRPSGAGHGLRNRINPEIPFWTVDYSKPIEAIERLNDMA